MLIGSGADTCIVLEPHYHRRRTAMQCFTVCYTISVRNSMRDLLYVAAAIGITSTQ